MSNLMPGIRLTSLVASLLILFMTPLHANDAGPRKQETTKLRPGQIDFDQGRFQKALNIWLPQAEAGDPEMQVLVGEMYRRGLGVPKDLVRAYGWHKKSADQDNINGIYHLAQYHLHGQGGVEKDPVHALKIYRNAADRLHWRAQYVVSHAYLTGEIYKKDLVKALQWLEISIASSKGEFGKRKVHYRRRGLTKHMTEDEVELAKKLAADWLKVNGSRD
jgi:TPR repeat protein